MQDCLLVDTERQSCSAAWQQLLLGRKFLQDRQKSMSYLSDTFFLTPFTAFSVVNPMSTLE